MKQAKSGATKARKAHAKQKGRKRPVGKPPSPLRRPRAPRPAPREVGLLDAIGEAVAICEELGEEMRSWADNMPESMQGGDKHGEVEQCADTLEEQALADPRTGKPDQAFLNEIKITIQDPTPSRRGRSRSTRLGDATSILSDVIEKLEQHETENAGEQTTMAEFKDACEDFESELQAVDFPGMFG